MPILAGRGIDIHSDDAHIRKELLQLFLDLLRACAEVTDVSAAALGALIGRRLHIAAIMAVQLSVST